MRVRNTVLIVLLACAAVLSAYGKPGFEITQTNADGVYKLKEAITWTIKAVDIPGDAAAKISYSVKKAGKKTIDKGNLDLSAGAQTVTASLSSPGTLLLEVSVKVQGQNKPVKALSGAAADPGRISPSLPKPADFDSFWEKKLAEQEKVPMNPVLTKESTSKVGSVDSWLITMDTIRNQKMRGRIARPKSGKKFPAMLIVQWAGVYGLDPGWAQWPAGQGWLVLNLLAHDQPVDKDKSFYTNLSKNELKGYTSIGAEDREKSYFLRMDLACSRAVDYLSTRPDWDGKTILVTGGSQGGYQSFVAAGLNKKVTAVIASVPAGCDTTAEVAGRVSGWPYWITWNRNKARQKTSQYYDGMNFATRITCPVLIGMGLADTTSRPDGIFAAANLMKGPVEIATAPNGGHGGKKPEYDKRAKVWKEALKSGKKPPVKKFH